MAGVWDKIKESIETNTINSNDDFHNVIEVLQSDNKAFDAVNQDGIKDRSKNLTQEEIDDIIVTLKKQLGYNDIQEVKSEIQKLQEEIEKLKKENQTLKKEKEKPEEKPGLFEEYAVEFDEAVKPVKKLFDKIFEENKIEAMAVSLSKIRISERNAGINLNMAFLKSIDDGFNEEGFSAACEVFTNPRRLTILKLLIKENLTASGIGQKTGLVGGQLYHHLTNLENAGLIKKEGDIYMIMPQVCEMIVEMYAVCGMMKIAKE